MEFCERFLISTAEIVDDIDRRGKGGGISDGDENVFEMLACRHMTGYTGLNCSQSLTTCENLGGERDTDK